MYVEECPLCEKEVLMDMPWGTHEWVFRVHFGTSDSCGASGLSRGDVEAVERMRAEGFRTTAHP